MTNLVLLIMLAVAELPTGVEHQTYNGELRHLDGVYAVSVSFFHADGAYKIKDSKGGIDGRLTVVKWETDHRLLLKWKDKHGEGFLRITFNKDFTAFRGKWWNPKAGYLQGYWAGRRAS